MAFLRSYPKLLLILASMFGAYLLYAAGGLDWLHTMNHGSEYFAVFIGGLLFSFGFTSPFGIGVFLEVGSDVNPLLGGIIGGFGSLLADLLIFEAMRFEFFHDELHRLQSTRPFLWVHGVLHHERFPQKVREYLLWSFAGLIIASPLPDEFGVALVSSVTDVKARSFALLCFSINTAAIIMILLISRGIA